MSIHMCNLWMQDGSGAATCVLSIMMVDTQQAILIHLLFGISYLKITSSCGSLFLLELLFYLLYSCKRGINSISSIFKYRKFDSNFSVPGEYFAHLDASGRRIDMDQRPELTKGSVDFVAPTEYMVRPPMPPLYFFLIDVSISAVKSGMLEVWKIL